MRWKQLASWSIGVWVDQEKMVRCIYWEMENSREMTSIYTGAWRELNS